MQSTNRGALFGVIIGAAMVIHLQAELPEILKEPTNTVAFPGSVTQLGVQAQSATPMSYQWFLEGQPLVKATNSSVAIYHFPSNAPGAYWVVISNTAGQTTSAVARISMLPVALWGRRPPNLPGNLPAFTTNLVKLQVNQNSGLMITRTGELYAWGAIQRAPTNVVEVADIALGTDWDYFTVYYSYGSTYALAFRQDNSLVAWCGNYYMDVPLGLLPAAHRSGVDYLAVGYFHYVGLRNNGLVFGGGSNMFGQAQPPAGLTQVIQVGAGSDHGVALRSDGTVAAWGRNVEGQCQVPDALSNVVAIATGGLGDHTLALQAEGTVVGWGFSTDLHPGMNIPSSSATIWARRKVRLIGSKSWICLQHLHPYHPSGLPGREVIPL